MPDLLSLDGRVAIVTGATRGIGLAIADKLAAHGATLILNARSDAERMEAVVKDLTERYGVPVSGILGDISASETATQLVGRAFADFRRLDIYVNNAGVLLDGLLGMIRQGDIETTLGVNLVGVLHGIQAASRLMQRSGGGSIVNLASIIGRVGNVGQVVYGASKAGVIGATLSAAKELAPKNIRVNAIAPGFIDTDMTRQLPATKFAERVQSIGMQRIGTPAEVADAALFFASDLSRYVTGQVLGVDGGMVI